MDKLEIKTIKDGYGKIISGVIDVEFKNKDNKKIVKYNSLWIIVSMIDNEVRDSENVYILKESLNFSLINKTSIEQSKLEYRIKNLKLFKSHGNTNYIIKRDTPFIRYKSNFNKTVFTGWILP